MDVNFRDLLPGLFGNRTKKRTLPLSEAREILRQEEAARLVDQDQVARIAVERAESSGIVFLDEIDKIAGRESAHGPDVSREGVQRDLLPIVEGTTVSTKYGPVRTDHILFIAAGAFHVSKPTDLIPELQGRFPIRVELQALAERGPGAHPDRAAKRPRDAVSGPARDRGDGSSVHRRRRREMARLAAQVNDRPRTSGPAASRRYSRRFWTRCPSRPEEHHPSSSPSTPPTCAAASTP